MAGRPDRTRHPANAARHADLGIARDRVSRGIVFVVRPDIHLGWTRLDEADPVAELFTDRHVFDASLSQLGHDTCQVEAARRSSLANPANSAGGKDASHISQL